MHKGTFDVLLHRTRGWLEGFASLERTGGEVRMHITKSFAVPDPRERESVESRVLKIIAIGGSTARAAAEATGLSLRQAQSILKTLAADGMCVAEKQGPKLHYRLEDTTFSEPTRL